MVDYLRMLALLGGLVMGSLAQAEDEMEGSNSILENLPQIIYIGTNDHPLENARAAEQAGITLGAYNLDAQRNLEHWLIRDLPVDLADPRDFERVQGIVQARFAELSDDDVRNAFMAVMLAAQWDIRKAPAFVFGNGISVIYGLTDAAVAIDHWRAWRRDRRP